MQLLLSWKGLVQTLHGEIKLIKTHSLSEWYMHSNVYKRNCWNEKGCKKTSKVQLLFFFIYLQRQDLFAPLLTTQAAFFKNSPSIWKCNGTKTACICCLFARADDSWAFINKSHNGNRVWHKKAVTDENPQNTSYLLYINLLHNNEQCPSLSTFIAFLKFSC